MSGERELGRTSLIEVRGRLLCARVRGHGPAVVLDCGGAGQGVDGGWGPELEAALAESATVVSYDRAGAGRSGGPAAATVAEMTEDLRELLRGLDVTLPAVFLGWSFGALVTQLYALRYPEDVAGLVFVDPTATERPPGWAWSRALSYALAPRLIRLRAALSTTDRKAYRELAATLADLRQHTAEVAEAIAAANAPAAAVAEAPAAAVAEAPAAAVAEAPAAAVAAAVPEAAGPAGAGPPGDGRPVDDRPFDGGPAGNRPSVGVPDSDRPVGDGPVGDGPGSHGPGSDGPGSNEPGPDEPAGERPSGTKPRGNEPASGGPSGGEPFSGGPHSPEPRGEEPPRSRPRVNQPDHDRPSKAEPGDNGPSADGPGTGGSGSDRPGSDEPGASGASTSGPDSSGLSSSGLSSSGLSSSGLSSSGSGACGPRASGLPRVPLRVLTAGKRPWMPSAQLEHLNASHRRLAGRSPLGRLVVVERASHQIPVEQPEAVVEAVTEVLRQGVPRQEVLHHEVPGTVACGEES